MTGALLTGFAFALAARPVAATAPAANGLTTLVFFFAGLSLGFGFGAVGALTATAFFLTGALLTGFAFALGLGAALMVGALALTVFFLTGLGLAADTRLVTGLAVVTLFTFARLRVPMR